MKNKLIVGIGIGLVIIIGILVFRTITSAKPLVTTDISSQAVTSPSPSPVPTPKVTIDSATDLMGVTDTLEPENFSADYKSLRSNL